MKGSVQEGPISTFDSFEKNAILMIFLESQFIEKTLISSFVIILVNDFHQSVCNLLH